MRQCEPPRGPGDNSRHSINLLVANVSCKTGRRVALTCARFSYGASGTCVTLDHRWACTSTQSAGSESTEICLVGMHLVRVTWAD